MAVPDLVNLLALIEDAKCFALVRQHRWPEGVHCPACGSGTRSTVLQPGCPDPVSPTVAPYPLSARPTPRWPRRAYAATAGALYVPPLTSRAQTMRAILLARAVVTSMRGLRASIRASHEPAAAPR